MKNKIILITLLTIASSFFFLLPSPILAQATDNAGNYGLDETAKKVDALSGQVSSYDKNFLQTKAGQIIGVVLSFVGALFLILMIYAGILWMISQGNEQSVTKAKGLIINAIIGIIIVFAAYALTSFLGNQLLSSSPSSSMQTTIPGVDSDYSN